MTLSPCLRSPQSSVRCYWTALLFAALATCLSVAHAEQDVMLDVSDEAQALFTDADRARMRKIRVDQNGSNLKVEELQRVLYQFVDAPTREHLVQGKDAVFIYATDLKLRDSSKSYCWAVVGLTEATAPARNPRVPTRWFSAARSAPVDASCGNSAVLGALRLFAQASIDEQLIRTERTRLAGGARPSERADPTKAHLFFSNLSSAGERAVFNALSSDFRKSFDYRRIQMVVVPDVFHFDDKVVCFAVAGIAARSPEERNPRFPGSWVTAVVQLSPERSQDKDAESRCMDEVAEDAVRARLEYSWDGHGLLAEYGRVREDGVPLVAPQRKPAPAATLPTVSSAPKSRAAPQGSCQPPAGKVLRYSDRCFNGDCTRTFENGCSVRFQAPYCYDALSGDWKWKPDGC